MKTVGTVARGIRAPMIQPGDDMVNIVVDSVIKASQMEGFALCDQDVVGITEAAVARAQSNFADVDQIAADIRAKFGGEDMAIVFPILSRNRFATCLEGIAKGCRKLYVLLSYPADEVGNHLMNLDVMEQVGINPFIDVLNEEKYRQLFGNEVKHPFTSVDYVEFYKSISDNIEIIFANDARVILDYTQNVLVCDVHTRQRTKRQLKEAGAKLVYGLDEILTESVNGSGYNPEYGLLGSNMATEGKVKLFPRNCQRLVEDIQKLFLDKTGKNIEVMVYGDGAFKDPIGKIWELADPVVSPGFTKGLLGTPNELKLKLLLDNELAGKSGEEVHLAMTEAIKKKSLRENSDVSELAGDTSSNKSGGRAHDLSLGTTPRHYTDLLGSLCDLVSGSGDKGTPIVLVSGYFTNYASE
ncbi:MAG: coenzyme F420-0:L-glutamate ligase [Lachnospiraceae bacterium]|jgi:F420-0:gamma-glutamyl ligase|nr:coenzyme F420-0:L-glutamate ligase [Lachnospiraceae bacterium]